MSKKKRKHKQTQAAQASQPAQPPHEQATDKPPAAGPLKSPRWLLWAFAAAIIAVSVAGYSGGLNNGFTNWDDDWLITSNTHIREFSGHNIQYWFNPMAPREELGNEYLPLRDLSYAVNYAFDGYRPAGYHATNLILHILNCLLVMLFAWRLTGRRWIGGVAGLLFAAHPVHVEAVSWLSSRKDLLSTFFLLLSANLYLSARRSRGGLMSSASFVQRVRESTRLSMLLAVLFFVCALLSKMTAVVLPALLLLVELFRGHKLHALSPAKRVAVQAPFWGVALLFTALASHVGSGLMREPYGANRFESLLTALSAITRDFQVLLAGYPMHAAVDMPVQTGFSLPVIIGLLILAALVAAGLIGWRNSRKGWETPAAMAWGVAGLGALWFLVALSPVSNFLVQIGTVFAERYLYIPSIGFCMALAALGVLAADHAHKLRPVLGLALCGLVALGTWGTMQATGPWVNSTSLWNHTLRHDPGNHVAWFNLARETEEKAFSETIDERREAMLVQAWGHYENALANPARTYRNDPARVYAAMALNQIHRKQPLAALELLEQGARHVDQPWRDERARRDIEALMANPRGLALSALGRHDEAVAAFEEALAKSDRYQGARVNLASVLTRQALEASPIDEDKLNRAKRELAEFEQLRGRNDQLIEARARLGLAEFDRRLALSGRGGESAIPADLKPLLDASRQHYRELVDLREKGYTARASMAATLIEAADAFARGTAADATAERYLRRALELKPDYLGLRYLLSQLLFEKDTAPARREATELLAEELNRHPDYRPALQLKAAGLRQRAVNEADALVRNWRAEYTAITKDTEPPTWYALVHRLQRNEGFRKQLQLVVTLMRQSIETDPANDEGHGLIDGSGREIAIAMWITRDNVLRAWAEDLLRVAFNARPMDGDVSAALTQFYLDLAEELLRNTKDDRPMEERRAEMDELLKNMLTLSERARSILSNKLFRTGTRVESGETKLRDENGEPMELSEFARRAAASEFIRAATLLNAENVEALDWLKKYYQEEGNYDEALKAFRQLIDALKDRPDLMHGIYLSLGQLQMDFGQQLLSAYRHKLRLGLQEEAYELRNRAVKAYMEGLETTGKLIDEAANPDKLNLPIRLRGVAAQRLAYLVAREAEHYYTIALQAYALAPLDFETEISEVRRKRAYFVKDPYARRRELEAILANPPIDADMTEVQQQLLDLNRRIVRIEADDFIRQGRLDEALAMVEPELRKAPTGSLYAIRGDVYLAMSKRDKDRRDELVATAARDYVRAFNEPEALARGGDLYWADEALRFEEDQVVRAREAYRAAANVIRAALPTLDEDSEVYERYLGLQKHIRDVQAQMNDLALRHLAAARRLRLEGKFKEALPFADHAANLMGEHPRALQMQAWILRDMSRAATDPAEKEELAVQSRAALNTALGIGNLLMSDRFDLMLDMIEVNLLDLKNRRAAREWINRMKTAIENVDPAAVSPEAQQPYRDRLRELEALLRE